MIGSFDKQQFVQILHRHLSPTTPIQSEENLRGRETQVEIIEQALYAPGRTVFIHGDRGVGKTSLARTVAISHQSARRDPVILACEPHTTFGKLLGDAIIRLNDPDKITSAMKHKVKIGITSALGYEMERSADNTNTTTRDAGPELDLNRAIMLLSKISDARNEDNVVVVDEFDRIASDTERTKFADFIKQLGDQSVRVRFVFCGVGQSLSKLLGEHASCFRYLQVVEVKRLGWEARLEIIDAAATALNITIEDRPRMRIAAISDGFPNYVHLVCEKLFWEMFNDPRLYVSPSADHYRRAVAAAVESIEPHLQQTYDKATMKEAQGYEEVLWAVADHADLARKVDNIHKSYETIMTVLDELPLERTSFTARLSTLKQASCGHILTSERNSYYQFRESIMRGYVRLRAEEQGLELASDFEGGTTARSSWLPRGAKRSRPGLTRSGWKKTKF